MFCEGPQGILHWINPGSFWKSEGKALCGRAFAERSGGWRSEDFKQKNMRKILIELQIDWEGYEDVSDELIVEDAIEAKVEGVGWTLLRQPLVISSVCEHPYASLMGEEHGNPKCLKCGKNLNEQTDL